MGEAVRQPSVASIERPPVEEIFALITKSMVACKGFTNPVLRAKASKDLGQLRLSLAKENERLKGFADFRYAHKVWGRGHSMAHISGSPGFGGSLQERSDCQTHCTCGRMSRFVAGILSDVVVQWSERKRRVRHSTRFAVGEALSRSAVAPSREVCIDVTRRRARRETK